MNVLLPWRSENGSREMLANHNDKLLDAAEKCGRVQILKACSETHGVCEWIYVSTYIIVWESKRELAFCVYHLIVLHLKCAGSRHSTKTILFHDTRTNNIRKFMLFQVFHILAAFFKAEPMTVATNTLATKTVKCNSVNAMFPRLIYADICSSFGCFFLCGSGQSTRSPPHPQNGPRYQWQNTQQRRDISVPEIFGSGQREHRCVRDAGREANLSMTPVQMPNHTRLPMMHNKT